MKKYIKDIENQITREMEKKHFATFAKQARYMGNGIYSMNELFAGDTRDLFVMYIATQELGYIKDKSGNLYKPGEEK